MDRGKRYSFNSLIPTLLKAVYSGTVKDGEIGYETAQALTDDDLATKHNEILEASTIPKTSVHDITFVRLKEDSGKTIMLALPWIDVATIQLLPNNINRTIKLTNTTVELATKIEVLIKQLNIDYTIE